MSAFLWLPPSRENSCVDKVLLWMRLITSDTLQYLIMTARGSRWENERMIIQVPFGSLWLTASTTNDSSAAFACSGWVKIVHLSLVLFRSVQPDDKVPSAGHVPVWGGFQTRPVWTAAKTLAAPSAGRVSYHYLGLSLVCMCVCLPFVWSAD